jgi:hypothetical protein
MSYSQPCKQRLFAVTEGLIMILNAHFELAQNKMLICAEAGHFTLITLYDTCSGSLVLIDQAYMTKAEACDNWGQYVRDIQEGYQPPEGETFFA